MVPMGTISAWFMRSSFSDFFYGSLHAIHYWRELPEAGMGRQREMSGGLLPLPPNMAFTSYYRVPKEKYND